MPLNQHLEGRGRQGSVSLKSAWFWIVSSRLDRDTNTVRFCERRIRRGIAVRIGGGGRDRKQKVKKNAKVVSS